jgi:aminoglycoside phosphotransferase (APT) family kinase protein
MVVDKDKKMAVIDVGGQVRHGEELDISAVENWLKDQGVNLQGQAQVTQYSGGASNWTYRCNMTMQI